MRAFEKIEVADLADLCQFLQRIDVVVKDTQLEPRHECGCSDLSGYLPWMGPRYGFPGKDLLSVFRGEGVALFLLARVVQPAVIAECYTGTGYSAAFLAAGWPKARVVSVDNYSEGGWGVLAYASATYLRNQLELSNLELIRGSGGELNAALGVASADLYFSDGPYGGSPQLAPDVVAARQDDSCGQVPERSFKIVGGSHFSVMCASVEERDVLAAEFSKVFPVVMA